MDKTYKLLLVPGLAVLLAQPGQASAVLKPMKGDSRNLIPRALDIRAQIDDGWAKTTVTTTYANANQTQIDAEFVYSAPPGAVVTGFAYWYGKERVMARVVEKSKAAQLYQVSQGVGEGYEEQTVEETEHDPALVEMVGKNLFRARLSPIAPRQNLKVEVQLAQRLDVDKKDYIWSYPVSEDARDYTLDRLRIEVNARHAPRIANNFGGQAGDGHLLVYKTNVHPETDLRATLAHTDAPLLASLATEHSGVDGFFALALHSRQSARSVVPKISGVETYDLMPIRLDAQNMIIYGRYRGQGDAVVSLGADKTTVWFGAKQHEATLESEKEIPQLAASLWGAYRMDNLSDGPNARSQMIAVSTRFGLPSKWTCWLALPMKKRQQFERQIQRIDLQERTRNLTIPLLTEMENGRELSPRALQLRAQLQHLERSTLGRRFALNEEKERRKTINQRLGELANLVMARRLGLNKSRSDAERKMKRLAGLSDQSSHPYLQRANQVLRQKQLEMVANRWVSQVVALQENTPKARKTYGQLTSLQARYGDDTDYRSEAYHQAAQRIAQMLLTATVVGQQDDERSVRLRDAGERFTRRLGQQYFQTAFFRPTVESALHASTERLLNEIEAGRDDSDLAHQQRDRIKAIYLVAPDLRGSQQLPGTPEGDLKLAYEGRAHETAYRLAQTQRDEPSDSAKIAKLQAQLERLSQNTESEADDILNEEQNRLRKGEGLRNARDYRLSGGDS